jgi:hypothetical protein
MGECELYLVCHCESNGLTSVEVERRYCVNRARDTFTMEVDGDMAGKIRGGWCLKICNSNRLARMDTSEKEKRPLYWFL